MPKSATLGFIGKGSVSARNTKALLNDELDRVDGNVKFLLPITEDHWNESLEHVAEYALKNDIPFEAVTDETTAKLKSAKEFVSEALKTHKVAKVTRKLVGLLADSPNAKLIVCWDDEDEEATRAFTLADEEGIEAFDLTSGLDKLSFGPPEAGDGEEPEEEPDDDEPKPEPMQKYTREELEELSFNELKDVAKALRIEVPNRTRTPGYIQAILDGQGGSKAEKENVVPEEADQSEDGKEAQIPEEFEPPDAVEGYFDADGIMNISAVITEAYEAVKNIPEFLQEQAFSLSLRLALDNALARDQLRPGGDN